MNEVIVLRHRYGLGKRPFKDDEKNHIVQSVYFVQYLLRTFKNSRFKGGRSSQQLTEARTSSCKIDVGNYEGNMTFLKKSKRYTSML